MNAPYVSQNTDHHQPPIGAAETDGLALKQEGIDLALTAHKEWQVRFESVVAQLSMSGKPFTSEDVVSLVGLPNQSIGPNKNNAVGAMMNGLGRRKVIRKTGDYVTSRRPSSRGAILAQWVKF